MLKCWNTGMVEYWNAEMLKCWNTGMLEYWNTGMKIECLKLAINITNMPINIADCGLPTVMSS